MRASKSVESLSPEDKAVLYQQILDFAPFVMEDSAFGVLVEKSERAGEDLRVTLLFSTQGAELKSTGQGEDFFSALKAAKVDLLNYLFAVQEAVANAAEDGGEKSALQKPNLH